MDINALPPSLNTFGEGSFARTGITQLEIPNGVLELPNNCFGDCERLESITLPVEFHDFNRWISGCAGLASIHYTVSDTGVMPDWDDAFNGGRYMYNKLLHQAGETLEEVRFDEGVTHIGAFAFYNTDEYVLFKRLALPATVTSIGDSAFYGASYLEEIDLPEGLTRLGDRCFRGSGLKRAAIPASVTSLGESCFRFCYHLTGIAFAEPETPIPNRTIELGESCFWGSGLLEIALPEGVRTIPDYCFRACEALTSVTLPDTLEGIGEEAFNYTSALKGPVRVPDGVNEIHSYAFDENVRPALEVYPYSGAHAFCVKEYWPVILLEYCRFALPSALTEVKDEAFEGTRAQLVEFPASCAHIGSAAFRGGEVRVILLPEGIGDIADDALQGCPLRTVVCNEGSKAWTWALAHGYTARTPFEEAW